MNLKKNLLNNKAFFIIFFGFIISLLFSFQNIKKFNTLDVDNNHLMVRGDLLLIWDEAESFKNDIKNKESIFKAGKEYTRTYLPSKILAIYSMITGMKLFKNFDNLVVNNENKVQFLIFQIFFYYICLIYFYKKYKKFFNNEKKSLIILAIFVFEPTLNQWHSSFWTESIFLSLQLFFLGMIMSKSKSNIFYFFTGIVLGLLFLQKTIAILLIFPFLIYLYFSNEIKKIQKTIFTCSGLFLILFYLGYSNFIKTGIFYIMPMQTKSAHYSYLVEPILDTKYNVDELKKSLKDEEQKIIKENNLNLETFHGQLALNKFKQKKTIEIAMNNKATTIYIYIKNTLHHYLLNPVQVYYWHKYNQKEFSSIEYHMSEDKKKWVIPRIIYSILIYSICFIGLINILLKKNKTNFYFFLLLCVLYYSFMLGWVGNTRYFMPAFALFPFFITEGLALLFKIKEYNILKRDR
tara:strand:- start:1826 stop:3214 length:1389 start_codon:yes stop_codon:yes gene_type:complete